ncbi:MAG TPA: alpha/beta hydrolase [Allosphingosinicella sp.]|nr:alpha/beta hydrolase [Allosphingosinicella sp.]
MATDLKTEKIALSTGVTLNVAHGGSGDPIIFLHGFPESHRTWRHQLAALSSKFQVVAPDQRGFAYSDKPRGVKNYAAAKIVDDVMALADALGIRHFTLVGHDWGGAVAWLAALSHPMRIRRLVIVNAPHPLIFQKSLIEDEAQREASQYINVLRMPFAHVGMKAMGLEKLFEKMLASHADTSRLTPNDRQNYLDEWAQPRALQTMVNWYRASKVKVPKPGAKARLPLWTRGPFPKIAMPTLVIWGLKDKALLPVQLAGLDRLVEDLRIVISQEAGHFVTWEQPELVTEAIRDFIADTPEASPGRP